VSGIARPTKPYGPRCASRVLDSYGTTMSRSGSDPFRLGRVGGAIRDALRSPGSKTRCNLMSGRWGGSDVHRIAASGHSGSERPSSDWSPCRHYRGRALR